MSRLAAHGWVCVSIDYRLSKRATWPDHIVDVKTALAWVRAHVAEYGGDPELVVITGGSSGGHLAALATLDEASAERVYAPLHGEPAPIAACVPLYGVYDFDNRLRLRAPVEQRLFLERPVVKVPKESAPDVYALASPLARVVEAAPPFLVVQGTSDNLVVPAESRAFVERLRAVSRSPVLYLEVPRGAHAFDAVPSIRTAHVVHAIEAFLDEVRAARAGR
jgi:acetyl esterase/lipase